MDKPIIFFSHSSKDANLVLWIKKRLMEITGGTIEIFQSSDGQSIPLGRNWVHKIEEGLKKASIMFIFITPNSITSNWIYFEAGFTYSKDIRVIPVGIDIDITLLKTPLNLLQGFNITSKDSLNNFISVINTAYNFNFLEQFTDEDYSLLESHEDDGKKRQEPHFIFQNIIYELSDYYDYNNKNYHNIKLFFENIINFLEEQNIKYSKDKTIHYSDASPRIESYTLLVQGIKIFYRIGIEDKIKRRGEDDKSLIRFEISLYNFEKSFNTFISLIKLYQEIDWISLNFYLLSNYEYLTSISDISAIIFTDSNIFSMLKNNAGSFSLNGKNVHFCIQKCPNYANIYRLEISFKPSEITYLDVLLIINTLISKSIIYKISD